MKKARIDKNKIMVTFVFKKQTEFYETLNQVKSITGRRYLPEKQCWTIPLTKDNVTLLSEYQFDLHDNVIDFLESENKKKKIIQKELEQINFNDNILFDYQNEHAKKLVSCLIKNGAALDASDTGTGKTFTALAIAKYLKLKPIVITPKSVMPSWEKVAETFGIDIFVSNYENYQRANNEYIDRKDTIVNEGTEEEKVKTKYTWETDDKHIIIFDEIHRCKNYKTKNAKILMATNKVKSKVLALSATIGDNPLHLYALGSILKIFKNYNDYWIWCYNRGVYKEYFSFQFNNTVENLNKIHKDIFPERGNRISIKDLGDKFPDNLIITDPILMDNEKKIKKIYYEMKKEIKRLNKKKETDNKTSKLTEILRARQEVELLKVPSLVELTQDAIEENNSVVIFVNYKETLKVLSKKLKTKCIIDGSVTGEERQKNIDAFQADKERVIICNIKAGGVGISLHDINGKYSRTSLVCFDYSAQEVKQTLGRIHRAGAKSPAIQKFILCKNTIEEEIAEKLQEKINNIHYINNGDLMDSELLKII